MIAPTHPLRALWQLAWAQLGADWVRKAATAPSEYVTPARSALLRGLSSVNFPAMLPVGDGRVFTAVDNIHPFWPLYAPAGAADPRGLLGDVCAALGVPEPAIGGTAITGRVLASRLERYLVQHPYVRTLVVNAFNAGRASVLADALVVLQRKEEFKDLRYDVRLFVPDPNAPGVGDSISALLAGDAGASDAFHHPGMQPHFSQTERGSTRHGRLSSVAGQLSLPSQPAVRPVSTRGSRGRVTHPIRDDGWASRSGAGLRDSVSR